MCLWILVTKVWESAYFCVIVHIYISVFYEQILVAIYLLTNVICVCWVHFWRQSTMLQSFCKNGVGYTSQGHWTGVLKCSHSGGVALVNYLSFLYLVTSYREHVHVWATKASTWMLNHTNVGNNAALVIKRKIHKRRVICI